MMNFKKIQQSFKQARDLIQKKNFEEAHSILTQLGPFLTFYKRSPFSHERYRQLLFQTMNNLKKPAKLNINLLTHNVVLQKHFQDFQHLLADYFSDAEIENMRTTFEVNQLIDSSKFNHAKRLLKSKYMTKHDRANVLYQSTVAKIAVDKENFEVGLKAINFCIDEEPANPEWHYYKALILWKSENLERAIEELEEAQRHINEDHYLYLQVMLDYYDLKTAQGELIQSIQSVELLKEAFPCRYEVYYYLSKLYLEVNQEIKSLNYADEAIKLSKGSAILAIHKSNILYILSRTDDALRVLMEALKRWPRHVRLLELLAEIFSIRGQSANAAAMLEKRFRLSKVDDYLYYHAAYQYFMLERFKEALNYVNKFIHAEDEDPMGYLLRAKIHAKTHYYFLSIEDLNKLSTLEEPSGLINDADIYDLSNLKDMPEFEDYLQKHSIQQKNED